MTKRNKISLRKNPRKRKFRRNPEEFKEQYIVDRVNEQLEYLQEEISNDEQTGILDYLRYVILNGRGILDPDLLRSLNDLRTSINNCRFIFDQRITQYGENKSIYVE